MKIGIDIRVLARGVRTGVEEYVINLLSHLFLIESEIQYKLFYNAYRKNELSFEWPLRRNVELKNFKIPNRLFFVSARYFNQPKIDRLLGGVDAYFNPHFFGAPVSSRCRKIMTVHDLSFEYFPEFFSWRKRLWQKFLMRTKKEARSADKIIAVSQSTKSDLVNLYGINEEKISVIYSGVGEQFQPISFEQNQPPAAGDIKRKYNLPSDFILYFGAIEPRKNIVGLINAFEVLREKHRIKLVVAGDKGWLYRDIFKTAKESKYRNDIVFTGFIEEKDKPCLYALAKLFVYPSFFEGFGFPPLEAMAGGVPTIVSNSSSLPEVVGESALMIDPNNIDELSWAMEMALTDSELRKYLIKKGIEQAKKFSWDECAKKTLAVLKQ
ncbi:MAG: hypothetical protein AUJ11_01345 [Parcubacteria group bacterium CG1_02_44_65]|uniref:Glycosyltransferase family 1 protein n=1 Tax=Candidatus Portnoybacteria bacterium CG_4_10_14_0_2_um_filter_43_36 TaxID=1974798 RepID=A0A2M7UE29_9BACT|nr:MAG: hypothetical protein AUJ11_01345 [Parcubacteria group bacterium CG1_02_44_65]PIZ69505.1 MAG: glycosyltransferase family 1 protein [Candidatus Portnoybacteria bacterium CG_4_10_14_0_2_um_filter_43_36]